MAFVYIINHVLAPANFGHFSELDITDKLMASARAQGIILNPDMLRWNPEIEFILESKDGLVIGRHYNSFSQSGFASKTDSQGSSRYTLCNILNYWVRLTGLIQQD